MPDGPGRLRQGPTRLLGGLVALAFVGAQSRHGDEPFFPIAMAPAHEHPPCFGHSNPVAQCCRVDRGMEISTLLPGSVIPPRITALFDRPSNRPGIWGYFQATFAEGRSSASWQSCGQVPALMFRARKGSGQAGRARLIHRQPPFWRPGFGST